MTVQIDSTTGPAQHACRWPVGLSVAAPVAGAQGVAHHDPEVHTHMICESHECRVPGHGPEVLPVEVSPAHRIADAAVHVAICLAPVGVLVAVIGTVAR